MDIKYPEPVDHRIVMQLFEAYLGAATTGRVGAQHVLNANIFADDTPECWCHSITARAPEDYVHGIPHFEDADPDLSQPRASALRSPLVPAICCRTSLRRWCHWSSASCHPGCRSRSGKTGCRAWTDTPNDEITSIAAADGRPRVKPSANLAGAVRRDAALDHGNRCRGAEAVY